MLYFSPDYAYINFLCFQKNQQVSSIVLAIYNYN